ncbi:TonB-dependent receptor domain-containing protein [Campylobacter geochelonis]|uniref:Putative outer membrane siderophore receptor n=1 Tax=Campylobacter geochelonis TaxID=1780362 RepID=A0A128E9Y0_9BACT|nr:TonB-dependent receptor [Campylobacter geochelonis]QKF70666.1 TonB-dependent heme/hemoglobin receptor family protein [Campylobacter geochelonis]CZE45826.1 Putative outer membrane siderophore receptor [Campylobacter geochelonis]
MDKFLKFSLVAALVLPLFGEDLEFDTLKVSGKKISNDEKPYITPGAVSSVDKIGSSTQSIDSLVRSMPGTYTNTDQSQGTVAVNIRGMTGLGRVNTMVDGVTQTFFGTSADNGKFHQTGVGMGTSVFGAAVDQNFLASVDVERGTFSGGHGGLMGSANFRTIGVDDVISDGNNFGFLGRYSYGSNGVGPSYMGSVASKFSTENGGSYGVLFGYSAKKISQNYKVGGGGKIDNLHFEDAYNKENDVSPFNPKELTQRPKGYLFKFEAKPDEKNSATLSYRRYENTLAGRDITNDNYQIDYRFNPDNNLLDLNLLLAYTKSNQKYSKDAIVLTRGDAKKGLSASNNALTFDISNNFLFDFNGDSSLNVKLGANYLQNEYKNRMHIFKTETTAFQPKGEQEIKTLYLDNTLSYDIFDLYVNLNLVNWELKGHKPECNASPTCFPKRAMDISKKDTNLNYSFMLSANIDELFSPFISYSLSTRAPNVQEMFFASDYGDSVNPFLKPEEAKTYQIGFNSFKHGLFTNDDRFGFKLTYYNTSVKDYIYSLSLTGSGANRWMIYANSLDDAKFKGIEAQITYDMGVFYTKASYSRQTSKQPVSETYGNRAFGFGKISELPKDYATIDIGTRLMDEKLTFGSVIKYTGKAKRVHPSDGDDGRVDPNRVLSQKKTQDLPQIPTIFDFYATYKPTSNLTFKVEVQNAFDKNYLDALNAFNSIQPELYDKNDNSIYLFSNSSRGRTFLASFEYKF